MKYILFKLLCSAPEDVSDKDNFEELMVVVCLGCGEVGIVGDKAETHLVQPLDATHKTNQINLVYKVYILRKTRAFPSPVEEVEEAGDGVETGVVEDRGGVELQPNLLHPGQRS